MSCFRLARALLGLWLTCAGTGCALGYGRAGAPAGGLWADGAHSFGEPDMPGRDELPTVFVRFDDEPPPPDETPRLGFTAGTRLGVAVGWFGSRPLTSGLAVESELSGIYSRPPFSLRLSAGYSLQTLDDGQGIVNWYGAPLAILDVGIAASDWLGFHVGGGALLAGRLHSGWAGAEAEVWGGRVQAGVDLTLFRGRKYVFGFRLEVAYSETGRTVLEAHAAGLQCFGVTTQVVGMVF